MRRTLLSYFQKQYNLTTIYVAKYMRIYNMSMWFNSIILTKPIQKTNSVGLSVLKMIFKDEKGPKYVAL